MRKASKKIVVLLVGIPLAFYGYSYLEAAPQLVVENVRYLGREQESGSEGMTTFKSHSSTPRTETEQLSIQEDQKRVASAQESISDSVAMDVEPSRTADANLPEEVGEKKGQPPNFLTRLFHRRKGQSDPQKLGKEERELLMTKLRSNPLFFEPEGLEVPGAEERMIKAHEFASGSESQSLEDCLRRAMEAHYPLEIAYDRQDLSRRRIISALRELFPELELEYKKSKGSNTTGAFQGGSWRINTRQPVVRGGQLWHKLKEEKENWKASLKEYENISNDLVFSVTEAYVGLYRAEQAHSERLKIFAQAETWRGKSKKKEEAALISEIERLNVESIYYEQKAELEIARQDVELARLELQRWLSLEASDEIHASALYDVDKLSGDEKLIQDLAPKEGNIGQAGEEKSLEDYIQLAYGNRPELALNIHRVKAHQHAVRAARGGFWPGADLIFEVGQLFEVADHIDPNSTFGNFDEEKEYRFGLEMDWNVAGNKFSAGHTNTKNAPNITSFSGGGEGTSRHETSFSLAILDNLDQFVEVKEAVIESKEAIQELEEAEKAVVEDVKKAYYDYQKSRVEVISLLRRLDHRQRLFKLSEIRLEKNEIQISEFLQALIDLGSDRVQMHRSLADLYIAKAALNRAVGVRDFIQVEDIHG